MVLQLDLIQLVHVGLEQLERLPERVQVPPFSLPAGRCLLEVLSLGFADELGLLDERLLVGRLPVDRLLAVGVERMEERNLKVLERENRRGKGECEFEKRREGRKGREERGELAVDGMVGALPRSFPIL